MRSDDCMRVNSSSSLNCKSAKVSKRHREDDLWTFGFSLDFWTFLDGLSLECLWTAWNGFQRELGWISAAICVYGQVAQAMAD